MSDPKKKTTDDIQIPPIVDYTLQFGCVLIIISLAVGLCYCILRQFEVVA